MKTLEAHLRSVRDSGRKALVPYFMAGVTPDWTTYVQAAAHAGADAIEIGFPFSDAMIDGVVIQEAALRALEAGTTLDSICAELATLEVDVPLIAMTYFNIFHHYGIEKACGTLASAGITGTIVPDLSPEESSEWKSACDNNGIANIFLVAPSTTPSRFESITRQTEGFCYASARMAVTGQSSDEGSAAEVVSKIRQVSDVPALVGIGISTPDQAVSSARVSDGVIVGSVLVKAILDGATVEQTEAQIREFRTALDGIS